MGQSHLQLGQEAGTRWGSLWASGLARRRVGACRAEAVSLQGCVTSFPPAVSLGSRRGLVVVTSLDETARLGAVCRAKPLLELDGVGASWLQADGRFGLRESSQPEVYLQMEKEKNGSLRRPSGQVALMEAGGPGLWALKDRPVEAHQLCGLLGK